jgi:hypothetical protein
MHHAKTNRAKGAAESVNGFRNSPRHAECRTDDAQANRAGAGRATGKSLQNEAAMNAPATAAETKSDTVSVLTLTKRGMLEGRIFELDHALVEHQRKAFAQQQAWRTEQASLEQQRNETLRQLSEL